MKKKPNVVYILADDMGYGDISANNENCAFQTPNLDNLCRRGMRFCDAHSTSAVCTPSRYGILTGRYNWRSVLKSSVIGGYSSPIIERDRRTLATLFRENGYSTSVIGKWHLGMNLPKTRDFKELPEFAACDGIDYHGKIDASPIDYGFDYYYGISASLDMPPYVYIENDHFTEIPDHFTENTGKKFWRNGPTGPHFVHENVLDVLTDKVLEQIEKNKDRPFFVYFPMPAPHTPILPAERFCGKSNTNEYGDFVLHCDDVVGRINQKLEDVGLLDDTIVVFASDNGCSPMANYPELLEKGHNPSYIFRGTKADIYEGGHRIPYIIQWPNGIKGNQVCESLVCLSDFYATIAEILGHKLADNEGEDSVSNFPLWIDCQNKVRDDVVHQSIDGSLSIRRGFWKLEMCPGSGGWSFPQSGEMNESGLRFQLYDLKHDIAEKVNVIEEHTELARELRDRLRDYILNGRSTPGRNQRNNGQEVWEAILWVNEDMFNIHCQEDSYEYS